MIHPKIDEFFRRMYAHEQEQEKSFDKGFQNPSPEERLNRDARRLARLDTAIVLGGNDEDRLPYVVELYERVNEMRRTPLRIICSGGSAGFTERERSEANDMALTLHRKGIPLENIAIEGTSRDTVANIVLTAPLLTPSERAIGIITSGYQIERASNLAQRVIAGRTIDRFGTETRADAMTRVGERAKAWTVKQDTRAITDGDREAWNAYLCTDHPFHAPYHGNKPSGLYTAACRLQIANFDATVERIIAQNKQ